MIKEKASTFLSLMYTPIGIILKNSSYLPSLSGGGHGNGRTPTFYGMHLSVGDSSGNTEWKELKQKNGPWRQQIDQEVLFFSVLALLYWDKKSGCRSCLRILRGDRSALLLHCFCTGSVPAFITQKTCAHPSLPVRVHCFSQSRWKSNLLSESFPDSPSICLCWPHGYAYSSHIVLQLFTDSIFGLEVAYKATLRKLFLLCQYIKFKVINTWLGSWGH